MSETLYTIATFALPLIFAIVLHEIAHGWVARYFGDMTAASLGRLTLNPIKHVDPVGTMLLPGFLAVVGGPIFGWAKPVPVKASHLRNPRMHMMLVAFAGPASNLILGLFAVLLLGASGLAYDQGEVGTVSRFIADNLSNFLLINIFLAFFNLLPIPPFDGSHILEGLLPDRLALYYAKLRPYGLLLFAGLILSTWLFPNSGIIEKLVLPPVRAMLQFYFSLIGIG